MLLPLGVIVRRKSHFKWNCCTDFFYRLIFVHNGLRQHFPEGVQTFVQWHFKKFQYFDSMTIDVARCSRGTRPLLNFQKNPIWQPPLHEIIKMPITPFVFVMETYIWTLYLGIKACEIQWKGYWCNWGTNLTCKSNMANNPPPPQSEYYVAGNDLHRRLHFQLQENTGLQFSLFMMCTH